MRNRDEYNLTRICELCIRIQQNVERFGDDLEIFRNDFAYRDAVCMSILQIGESVNRFSDEYRATTINCVNWRGIKNLRNVFAHSYETVRVDEVWSIVKNNMPDLQSFCERQIKMLQESELEITPKSEQEQGLTMG